MTKYLTRRNLTQISLIFALITQISHAAEVFKFISHESNIYVREIFAYIFAISLELSIYIFTLKGKKRYALYFGIISSLINIFYYRFAIELTVEFVSSIIVSLIVPIIIYVYSDLMQDENKKKVGRPVGTYKKPKVEKVKKEKIVKTSPKKEEPIILKEEVKNNIKERKSRKKDNGKFSSTNESIS